MARYRVLEASFINFVRLAPGAEVDYDGKPDGNLEPLDNEARVAVEARTIELAGERAAASRKKLIDDLL